MKRLTITSVLLALFLALAFMATRVFALPTATGNDLYAGAFTLTPIVTGSVEGTNTDKNTESAGGTASAWFLWQAPNSGTFSVDTLGSNFNTFLSVYSGNSPVGTPVTDADSGGGVNGASKIQNYLVAKDAYYLIAVSSQGTGRGHYVLNWTFSNISGGGTDPSDNVEINIKSPVHGSLVTVPFTVSGGTRLGKSQTTVTVSLKNAGGQYWSGSAWGAGEVWLPVYQSLPSAVSCVGASCVTDPRDINKWEWSSVPPAASLPTGAYTVSARATPATGTAATVHSDFTIRSPYPATISGVVRVNEFVASGVSVQLFAAAAPSVALQSRVTSGSGYYEFSQIEAGHTLSGRSMTQRSMQPPHHRSRSL